MWQCGFSISLLLNKWLFLGLFKWKFSPSSWPWLSIHSASSPSSWMLVCRTAICVDSGIAKIAWITWGTISFSSLQSRKSNTESKWIKTSSKSVKVMQVLKNSNDILHFVILNTGILQLKWKNQSYCSKIKQCLSNNLVL